MKKVPAFKLHKLSELTREQIDALVEQSNAGNPPVEPYFFVTNRSGRTREIINPKLIKLSPLVDS